MKFKKSVYITISVFIVTIILLSSYFLINTHQNGTSNIYDVVEYDQPFKQEFDNDEYNEIVNQLEEHGYQVLDETFVELPDGTSHIFNRFGIGNIDQMNQSQDTYESGITIGIKDNLDSSYELDQINLIEGQDISNKYYYIDASELYHLRSGSSDAVKIPNKFKNAEDEWVLELFRIPHVYTD